LTGGVYCKGDLSMSVETLQRRRDRGALPVVTFVSLLGPVAVPDRKQGEFTTTLVCCDRSWRDQLPQRVPSLSISSRSSGLQIGAYLGEAFDDPRL
jgi:hypothetical protein